jgi:hypothetical protein
MEATEPLFGGDMSADELIDSYPTDTFHRDYVISPPTPPLQPPTPPAVLATQLQDLNSSLLHSLATTRDIGAITATGSSSSSSNNNNNNNNGNEFRVRKGAPPLPPPPPPVVVDEDDEAQLAMGLFEKRCIDSIQAFQRNQAQPFLSFVEGMRSFAMNLGPNHGKKRGVVEIETGAPPKKLTPYMRVGALQTMAAHLASTWEGVKDLLEDYATADTDAAQQTPLGRRVLSPGGGRWGSDMDADAFAALSASLESTDATVGKLLETAVKVGHEWADPSHLDDLFQDDGSRGVVEGLSEGLPPAVAAASTTNDEVVVPDYGAIQDEAHQEDFKAVCALHTFRSVKCKELAEGVLLRGTLPFNVPLHDPRHPVSPRRSSLGGEVDVVPVGPGGEGAVRGQAAAAAVEQEAELARLKKLCHFRKQDDRLSCFIEAKKPPPPTPMEPYQVPWYYINERCEITLIDHSGFGERMGYPPAPLVPVGSGAAAHLPTAVTIPPGIQIPRIDADGADDLAAMQRKHASSRASSTAFSSSSWASSKEGPRVTGEAARTAARAERLGWRHRPEGAQARRRIEGGAPMNFNLHAHESHGRSKPDHLRILRADRALLEAKRLGHGDGTGAVAAAAVVPADGGCPILRAALAGPLPQTAKLVERYGYPRKTGTTIAAMECNPMPVAMEPHLRMMRPSYAPSSFALEKQHVAAVR